MISCYFQYSLVPNMRPSDLLIFVNYWLKNVKFLFKAVIKCQVMILYLDFSVSITSHVQTQWALKWVKACFVTLLGLVLEITSDPPRLLTLFHMGVFLPPPQTNFPKYLKNCASRKLFVCEYPVKLLDWYKCKKLWFFAERILTLNSQNWLKWEKFKM